MPIDVEGNESQQQKTIVSSSSSLTLSSVKENANISNSQDIQPNNTISISSSSTTTKELELVESLNQNNKNSNSQPIDTTTTTTTSIEQLQQKFIKNQEQREQRRSSSRSYSVQQDPIIAPGFGTKRDLHRLARELNLATTTTTTNTTEPTFTVTNIQYLMERRGRGIASSSSSSKQNDDTTKVPVATFNAWDDFMQEAGVVPSSTTKTTATTSSSSVDEANVTTGKRGRSSVVPNNEATAVTSGKTSSSTERVYDLESLQLPGIPASNSTKKSKTTTAGTVSTNGKVGGRLLQTGTLDVSMIGRKDTTNKKGIDFHDAHTLCVPTQILSSSIQITKVITAGHACHNIAISMDGIAYGWGRNEQYQLGTLTTNHVRNVYQPTPLVLSSSSTTDMDPAEPVIDAAVGKGHTILLFANGEIKSSGWNKSGQCGINNSGMEIVSNFRSCIFTGVSETPIITQVACGEDFTVALDTDGYMYSAGSSEYGQLGNGETGQYFVTASKLVFANSTTFIRRSTYCWAGSNEKIYGNSDTNTKIVPLNEDIRIQQIACGKHHSIALEANSFDETNHPPRVFTWGCGDYGVLGHGVQADEYFPRLVASLSNVRLQAASSSSSSSQVRIAAGQHCSLLQTLNGHVYYWGKHRTIGEATMRPTLVDALANNAHVVTQIGAGGQTVVCCTEHKQTVSWGQGTHGELGFGIEKKSSSKPSFVEGLEGCYVLSVACGYGTTLFVVRDDNDEDKKVVEKIPMLDASVPKTLEEMNEQNDSIGDDEPATKPGKKGKSKK